MVIEIAMSNPIQFAVCSDKRREIAVETLGGKIGFSCYKVEAEEWCFVGKTQFKNQ